MQNEVNLDAQKTRWAPLIENETGFWHENEADSVHEKIRHVNQGELYVCRMTKPRGTKTRWARCMKKCDMQNEMGDAQAKQGEPECIKNKADYVHRKLYGFLSC